MEQKKNKEKNVKKLLLLVVAGLLVLVGCGNSQSKGGKSLSKDSVVTRTFKINRDVNEADEVAKQEITVTVSYQGKKYKKVSIKLATHVSDEFKDEVKKLIDAEDDKAAFDIGIDVFVLQRFQPKTLVQIDDRNDFPAQIDDPFDVIRRIRDGTYILYFYNFLYIHDIDAVYFIAELKRYELKLGIFSGHMCSLKAVFVIIYHIYTFCNIQSTIFNPR